MGSISNTPLPPLLTKPRRAPTVVYPNQDRSKDATPIKILTLLPGGFEDRLQGDLSWLLLRDLKYPSEEEYEALSYHWGNKRQGDFQPTIRIWDKVGPARWKFSDMEIYPNLEVALRHLRFADKIRRLWIDSICINQDDKGEKSQQIPIMDRIYSQASNVCVWLGGSDELTRKAFELVRDIRDLKKFDVRLGDGEFTEHWRALLELMKREWFSRRWVVQEVAFARKATVHCGEQHISWPDLADAVALFTTKSPEIAALFREKSKYKYRSDYLGDVDALGASRLVSTLSMLFRKSDDGEKVEKLLSLESLVSNLSAFNATKPHDIIYAILSLANDTITSAPALESPEMSRRSSAAEPIHQQTIWSFNRPEPNDTTPEFSDVTSSERGQCKDSMLNLGVEVTNRQPANGEPQGLEANIKVDGEERTSVSLSPKQRPGTEEPSTPNEALGPKDSPVPKGLLGPSETCPTSEESIKKLLSFGFKREDAEFALRDETVQGEVTKAKKLLETMTVSTERLAELGYKREEAEFAVKHAAVRGDFVSAKSLCEIIHKATEKLVSDGYKREEADFALKDPAVLGNISLARALLEKARPLAGKRLGADLIDVMRALGNENVDGDLTLAEELLMKQKVTKQEFVKMLENRVRNKIFHVDYENKEFYEVCKDFIRFTVKSSKSLDMLCRPWAPENAEEDLPSWICTLSRSPLRPRPDGTYGRVNADLLVGLPGSGGRIYNASRTTRPEFATFGPGEAGRHLFVHGFVLDEIERIESPAVEGNIPRKWVELGNWNVIQDADPPESFWRTLVADRDEKGLNPPTYYRRACKYAFAQRASGGSLNTGNLIANDISKVMTDYLKRVQSVVYERRLVKTKRLQKLGLVPDNAERGDMVCIIRGCSVPVILRTTGAASSVRQPHRTQSIKRRPSEAGPRRHISSDHMEALQEISSPTTTKAPRIQFRESRSCLLIGECYIHGVMDGEAFKIRDEHEIKEMEFEIQ